METEIGAESGDKLFTTQLSSAARGNPTDKNREIRRDGRKSGSMVGGEMQNGENDPAERVEGNQVSSKATWKKNEERGCPPGQLRKREPKGRKSVTETQNPMLRRSARGTKKKKGRGKRSTEASPIGTKYSSPPANQIGRANQIVQYKGWSMDFCAGRPVRTRSPELGGAVKRGRSNEKLGLNDRLYEVKKESLVNNTTPDCTKIFTQGPERQKVEQTWPTPSIEDVVTRERKKDGPV